MITGFVDSTVLIHLLRKNLSAKNWLTSQLGLAITPIVWLEIVYGARGKQGQMETLQVLSGFDIVYLTQADQVWAMEHLRTYRLSHGVEINDCLIASVSHRLQVPLYTHNIKDMTRILDPGLVIKPY
jgi:predicted nucleic acid-binding protein